MKACTPCKLFANVNSTCLISRTRVVYFAKVGVLSTLASRMIYPRVFPSSSPTVSSCSDRLPYSLNYLDHQHRMRFLSAVKPICYPASFLRFFPPPLLLLPRSGSTVLCTTFVLLRRVPDARCSPLVIGSLVRPNISANEL